MDSDVTVVIPTIPPRSTLLEMAYRSCLNQDYPAAKVVTVTDVEGVGPARTRNTGLQVVSTEWVAFLDDDDYLYPSHLRVLMDTVREREAAGLPVDLVYPWFDVQNGVDPLAVPVNGKLQRGLGVPFGPEQREHFRVHNFIPVTTLVRTALAKLIGGFPESTPDAMEDYGFLRNLLDAGATFVHAPHVTWVWRHHLGNTSGRPWKSFQ